MALAIFTLKSPKMIQFKPAKYVTLFNNSIKLLTVSEWGRYIPMTVILLSTNLASTIDTYLNKALRVLIKVNTFGNTKLKGADPLILVKTSVFFYWKIVFMYGVIMS